MFRLSGSEASTIRWIGLEFTGSGSHSEAPAAFMGCVVMFRAQRDHVPHIGRPAVLPVLDVVNLADVERHGTSIERTRVMCGFECSALRR